MSVFVLIFWETRMEQYHFCNKYIFTNLSETLTQSCPQVDALLSSCQCKRFIKVCGQWQLHHSIQTFFFVHKGSINERLNYENMTKERVRKSTVSKILKIVIIFLCGVCVWVIQNIIICFDWQDVKLKHACFISSMFRDF